MTNLTFIIPAYNVEKFISKAISSVIENEWNEHSYEILVIDDGSPDGTLGVVEKMITQYPDILLKVISQKNKGLGGARNTGLEHATGDYIFFLDADDYILPFVFEKLLMSAYKNNLDVLEFAACRVDQNYEVIDDIFLNDTHGAVMNGIEYVKTVDFGNSACNKLYRREFLLHHQIHFFEKVYIEDAPFNIEVFCKAHRVMAVQKIAVAYHQNSNSITRTKRHGAHLDKLLTDYIFVSGHIDALTANYPDIQAQSKIKRKVASFVSGILWMTVFGKGISIARKKGILVNMKNKALLPYHHKTGHFLRDSFLYVMNSVSIFIKA